MLAIARVRFEGALDVRPGGLTMDSIPSDYFERMFADDPDPWKFESSAYEAAKYGRTVAALGDRTFERVLEVGCANGVLTQRLSPLCASLIAVDVSDSALTRARARNIGSAHVKFANASFPSNAPDGLFGLIVLSEVVYYWSEADIASAGSWIAGHLCSGGCLLLVHWIGETNYPQTGDDAVRLLREALPRIAVVHAERHDEYRLDLWRFA
jgi:predicted TPR repeat methyltransferase